ncbi:MAG: cohesin domain-containing protein [Candidatus Acidiferrales bacterium]
MRTRYLSLPGLALLALLTVACPKGGSDYDKGVEAELRKDYDTALIHYERAHQADPKNQLYEMRAKRIRFHAAQMHVDRGHKLRDQGLLEPSAAEFEKALAIDPSSFVAEQELRRTLEMIVQQRQAEAAAAAAQQPDAAPIIPFERVPEGPPELRPVSRAPIDLRVTEDAKKIFETIARLAGINVIFDPEFQPRRITLELERATLEQALDISALMTKTFWKTVTPNTIMVIPDNAAKRRSYEEQIIKTFYLSNTLQAAELNEIVQLLRTIVDVKRISPSTANNAIIIRDTPDKMAVCEKIIRDIDQARPEILIQVAVLQARRDRARELGIIPSTSVPLIFTPRTGVQPENPPADASSITLGNLRRLSSQDYSVILPSATAMALLTDATTKVVQNPEVRATDGQTAKLRIGDRVPYAVGSFQPGIGGVGVNPLVNTQFQYQDVGVNLDITPRVHSNREISLRVKVEVSAVTGNVNIGGISQPIFGQRIVEHDIRLKEGEVNILGGIVERGNRVIIEGWPGLGQIPFLRFLFSSETKELQENEVLIVLTPRIIRLPEITAMNVRPMVVGTDEQVSLPKSAAPAPAEPQEEPQGEAPAPPPTGTPPAPTAGQPQEAPPPQPTSPQAPAREPSAGPQMTVGFSPQQGNVKAGERLAVSVVASNASNLFAVPFQLSYDSELVRLVEIHHGGFLGGEQPAALVHRIDAEAGTAIVSVSRPPGTGGVSGEGALVTLVFEGLAAGRARLVIQNISARDAQQRGIDVQTTVGEILVEE